MMHRAFFGDGEHSFALPAAMILELEKTTGAGIGTLLSRVLARQFAYADLTETIRLGLIGGGSNPQDAKHLVTLYGEQRPIAEMIPVALGILTVAWVGPEAGDQNDANQPDDPRPIYDRNPEQIDQIFAARTGDLAAAISEAA